MDRSAGGEQAQLSDVVERLVRLFQPESIYLFGSRARGDWREGSDYDLMVIVPSSTLPPYRRAQLAYRELLATGAGKDIIVWTREEFDRYRSVVASLAATVAREGRLLYAA